MLLSDILCREWTGWRCSSRLNSAIQCSGHHYDRTFRSGCCRQRLSTGAFDYLPKPFDIDEAVALVGALSVITRNSSSRVIFSLTANDRYHRRSASHAGRVPYYRSLSRSSISVLINGESGTGKERSLMPCIATVRAPKRRLSR